VLMIPGKSRFAYLRLYGPSRAVLQPNVGS
jgi:hypothetical protein